jgi:OPA family glycerol-3-phosphate transporter-like MFS transporter
VGAYFGFLGTGGLLLGYLASIWTLNMYFQSYSALAVIKVNSAWFHVSERGVFSAIFGSMIQMGRFGVYALMTVPLVVALPWQWKFFLPAMIVSVFVLLTFLFVRDTPADAGLPEFDPQDATSGDTEKITFSYVAKKIFTNPIDHDWCAEFCTGSYAKDLRNGSRYMQEVQHLTPTTRSSPGMLSQSLQRGSPERFWQVLSQIRCFDPGGRPSPLSAIRFRWSLSPSFGGRRR